MAGCMYNINKSLGKNFGSSDHLLYSLGSVLRILKDFAMKLGLLLLIGVPGSGKTTLATTIKHNFNVYGNDVYNFIHVCYDDFITFQDFLDVKWKSARNSVASVVQKLIESIKMSSLDLCPELFKNEIKSLNNNSKVVLIIDDNMYYKSMRYSMYQIAKSNGISFCQVFINCSLENALLKNSLRQSHGTVPALAIEKMFDKLEKPDARNYWERFSLKIEAFSDVNSFIDDLFIVLNKSLNNSEYKSYDDEGQKKLSVLQCKTSVIHQTDIALRHVVGLKIKEFIKENPCKNNKEIIFFLNQRKNEILADVRVGNIHLPDEVLKHIKNNYFEKCDLINFLKSYF